MAQWWLWPAFVGGGHSLIPFSAHSYDAALETHPGIGRFAANDLFRNLMEFPAWHTGRLTNSLADFARPAPTRYEQLAILRRQYGFTELIHPLRADLLAFARGMAVAAPKDKYVVSAALKANLGSVVRKPEVCGGR